MGFVQLIVIKALLVRVCVYVSVFACMFMYIQVGVCSGVCGGQMVSLIRAIYLVF